MDECEVNGVRYVAQPDLDGCHGCAGRHSADLCGNLPECLESNRDDGRDVIWVEAEASLPLAPGASRLTPPQARRLYDNSPQAQKDCVSFAAFERVLRLVENVHRIGEANHG